jgi:FHA domain
VGRDPAADIVVDDRRPTARLPLPAKVMRIGRTPENDLVVSDLGVSRQHAELRKSQSGRYQTIDLSSHNGTFVNGALDTAPNSRKTTSSASATPPSGSPARNCGSTSTKATSRGPRSDGSGAGQQGPA